MSICLSPEEIVELTGRKYRSAQQHVLVVLGIEHRIRPDGSIVVSREHVEEVLGAKKRTKAPQTVELNWDTLKGSPDGSRQVRA